MDECIHNWLCLGNGNATCTRCKETESWAILYGMLMKQVSDLEVEREDLIATKDAFGQKAYNLHLKLKTIEEETVALCAEHLGVGKTDLLESVRAVKTERNPG